MAAYSAITSFDLLTNVIGIGGLALGFIPLYLSKQRGGALQVDMPRTASRV